jgi:hypothetical protein
MRKGLAKHWTYFSGLAHDAYKLQNAYSGFQAKYQSSYWLHKTQFLHSYSFNGLAVSAALEV